MSCNGGFERVCSGDVRREMTTGGLINLRVGQGAAARRGEQSAEASSGLTVAEEGLTGETVESVVIHMTSSPIN